MDFWLGILPYILVAVGGLTALIGAIVRHGQANRRRLTTVTARLGLFLSWIATTVAVFLGCVGAVVCFTETAAGHMWFAGGFSAAALIVWLLGRGIFFVLAGSPPEEPQTTAP